VKAIQQLISYFEAKGRLSARQIEQMVARGFWEKYTGTDLPTLEKQVGHTFYFQATGSANGRLWGTDVYTSDSDLGTACAHAGLLRVGETGTVKVTIVKPLTVFPGSRRHGVMSQTWTNGWSGAFTVERFTRDSAGVPGFARLHPTGERRT